MSQPAVAYTKRSRFLPFLVVSVVLLAALSFLLYRLSSHRVDDGGHVLTVYCAAGIRPPVVAATEQFFQEQGTQVRLIYNNSGGLLSTIALRPEGDLYVPADALYVERGREKGLFAESIPLARFRLVVAVKKGNPKNIRNLDDVLRSDVNFVVCNTEAGAGHKTKGFLEKAGRWADVNEKVKTMQPTVVAAAEAVKTSPTVDAGFIWDATARQFDLEIVPVAELEPAVATISVAVLKSCEAPATALRLARYLAAPTKGGEIFKQHGYDAVAGDAWAVVPKITVYAGGVNRDALEPTLLEFEKREGCEVQRSYDGCGTLVGKIQTTPLKPELFVTCDASYLSMVADLFLDPTNVSETDIVLLVRDRPGVTVRTLHDLTQKGLNIGITEPRASTLGKLSIDLLKDVGIWERVQPNIVAHGATAHDLILKMEAHDKLDVALVYRANCQNVSSTLKIVAIEHPRAKAVQNMALGRDADHPQLIGRLMEAIRSSKSQQRFESTGFVWRGEPIAVDS